MHKVLWRQKAIDCGKTPRNRRDNCGKLRLGLRATSSRSKLRHEATSRHSVATRDEPSLPESDVSFRFLPADPPRGFVVDYLWVQQPSPEQASRVAEA